MSSVKSVERNREPDTLSLMPTFITVDELAVVLRVNRNTAYEAVQRGDIPGVSRIGRKIRICRATVVDWLRGQGRDAR